MRGNRTRVRGRRRGRRRRGNSTPRHPPTNETNARATAHSTPSPPPRRVPSTSRRASSSRFARRRPRERRGLGVRFVARGRVILSFYSFAHASNTPGSSATDATVASTVPSTTPSPLSAPTYPPGPAAPPPPPGRFPPNGCALSSIIFSKREMRRTHRILVYEIYQQGKMMRSDFYGKYYYGYQIISGSVARWEGSWLGFNHWSITGM